MMNPRRKPRRKESNKASRIWVSTANKKTRKPKRLRRGRHFSSRSRKISLSMKQRRKRRLRRQPRRKLRMKLRRRKQRKRL